MFQTLKGGDEITLPKLVKSDDIKTPEKPSPVVQKWLKNRKYFKLFVEKCERMVTDL
jgi:hypothetical protein